MESSSPSSLDPDQILDLLLTVGHLDGLLHHAEQSFIHAYIERLVERFAEPSTAGASRSWFQAAYARLDTELQTLAAEIVAAGDDRYIPTRLKVRAVAIFRSFTPADQAVALELLGAMMQADGEVSAPERELFDELIAYFHAAPSLPAAPAPKLPLMTIAPTATVPLPAVLSHPLLDPIEQRYATDPATRAQQAAADYDLVFRAITVWERQRAKGNGRLLGVTDIEQLALGTRFLDGHVHVFRPERATELYVLGDIHGCYSCLKAALLQSDFIARASRNEDVMLVLLGDYLDRGRWSFEGVVRAALQLLVAFPERVVVLRGNHEFLVRNGERITSGVNPAEAVPGITDRVPFEVLEGYRHLFEHMPTSFLFERTLFVHGGIPREDTIAGRFRDLSGLEDPVARFEMMWSDPVATDRVPVELQRESPRFSFGRDQFRSFAEQIGITTLIRGHEAIEPGMHVMFDVDGRKLVTLFSSGGRDNEDLPAESRYRTVAPMALTVAAGGGIVPTATPWAIDYRAFVTGATNGLYR